MFKVLFREDGLGLVYLPVDAEGWILYRNAAVSFGMVVVVTFILEDSYITENSKAMGEASGDKELAMVVLSQFYSYMLAIGW